jgi:hypothetical protein
MRRLQGQSLTTANNLSDDLDRLSEFLGPQDQELVDRIITRLSEIGQLPDRYVDLVTLGREAVNLYDDLLQHVSDVEGFEEDGDYTTESR